MHEMFTEKLK